MKIAVGNDHRGVAAKNRVVSVLMALGHEVSDLGAQSAQSVDYPDYAIPVAEAVAAGRADRGVLICATGHGMCIAANKVFGVRAANCRDLIDADVTMKVDGQKLSGTMNSQAGEITFTGEVKEKALTISFEVQTPQGNLSITMQGEQKGDGLAGTFDFGQGTGDWTGKKK